MSKHRRPPQAGAFTLAERFARVERQTLRKLPVPAISSSPSVSMSIRSRRSYITRRQAELAASFAAQLEALDEQQTAYKGLTLQKTELAAKLRMLAHELSPA